MFPLKFRYQLAAAFAFDYLTFALSKGAGFIDASWWLLLILPIYALIFACFVLFALFVLGYLFLVVRAIRLGNLNARKY